MRQHQQILHPKNRYRFQQLLVQILDGHADVYVHTTRFYEWDIAAPLGIAIAGGLAVCDIFGNQLKLNQDNVRVENVIVCRPELLKVVLQAVS